MRARNIKPSLFKNELLGEADPLLTLLFEGLWCLADREGRLEDRPKRIKAEVFPYREGLDINGYLTELERMGFIYRYSVDNSQFIQVENFTKHQSPHKTERASEIPEKPLESDTCNQSVEAPLNNGSLTVKESLIPDSGFLIPDSLIPDKESGAEKDSPPTTPQKSKSKRFTPPTVDAVNDYLAERQVFDRLEAEKFRDFYESKNWMVGKNKMVDWKAAVRNWLKNYKPNPPGGQPHAPSQRIDNSAAGRVRANIARERAAEERAAQGPDPMGADVIDVWSPMDERIRGRG